MNTPATISDLARDLSQARLQAEPLAWTSSTPADLPTAYAAALAVRAARSASGDTPVGYKIGFTNRSIWPIYGVYAPIWGTVWKSTLTLIEPDAPNEGVMSLKGLCEPRIEPEVVFCLRAAPPPNCQLEQLASVIDWVAHGFEIVHTHFPGWKFSGAQAAADDGLHGRLLVGHRVRLAPDLSPGSLVSALASLSLKLYCDGVLKDEGVGANVLDGPVQALLHFVQELRATPGAPALLAGDLITTGTLTNAYAVQSGQVWHSGIQSTDAVAGALEGLKVRFE